MESRLGLFGEGEILHTVVSFDNEAMLRSLLDSGVHGDVNSVDECGRTALHIAAINDSAKCALLLLEREADPNAISGLEDDCSTPLHHAAKRGNLRCLKELLEYEADLDLKNNFGQTVFDIARENADIRCYDYLLQVQEERRLEYEESQREELYYSVTYGNYHDAKKILEGMTQTQRAQAINKFYRTANTLLYKASYAGHKDIVELLLDHGADGRQNFDTGVSPLYAAALSGHLPVVELLGSRLPHLRTLRVTTDLTEPLHIAASQGHVKVVKYLLNFRIPSSENGVGDETNTQAESPVFTTDRACNQQVELNSGGRVNVNTVDRNGLTALHFACRRGHRQVVQELLKCEPIIKGEDPAASSTLLVIDARSETGWTPLLCAVEKDHQRIVAALLDKGAEVNATMTNDNYSALQIACRLNDEALVQLLLDYGARDVDEVARIDSVRKGNDKLTQTLLSKGVYNDQTYKACLTAEEAALELSPVLVEWHNRKLDMLKEKWIIDSVISVNRHVKELLLNNVELKMKLITRLNLSSNSLEEVPSVIFKLPSLQTLDLSNNRLKSLPEVEILNSACEERTCGDPFASPWQCHRLEVLELQGNKLTHIPETVFLLRALIQLDISHNEIISLPYEMWIAPALKSMLVAKNNLRCLPSFPVDFDGGFLSSRAFTRSSSSPLATTDGSDVSFVFERSPVTPVASPSRITNRRPTWEEDEDSSDPEDINDQLDHKSGLDRLDISENGLIALPPGLACLAPNLTRLNASGNRISEISGIWSLPATLSLLDLSDNALSRFDLSSRQLGVDKTCYSMYHFPHPPLSKTSSFPQPLSQTASAKIKLCKHRNHRALLHLRQLSLSRNRLEQLPLVIGANVRQPGLREILFPDLQSLGIAYNQFREVPLHIGKLEKLGSLLLSGNKIDCLPPELGQCSGLYELKLAELALRYPPRHVLERKLTNGQMDVNHITSFLKSVYENSKPYPHIKLMLVGLGNIGKTTLLERLRREGSGSYQLPGYQPGFHRRRQMASDKVQANVSDTNVSTVGVEVCDWTYAKKQLLGASIEVKFSTWDFGGQHEYYATHSCFLSRRALYLLLWKMTDGEKGIEQLEPWLLNIQSRAGDSPVIIVGTHYDKITQHYKKRYVDKLHQLIMTRYVCRELGGGVVSLTEKGLPRVLHVIEVSSLTGHNIRELRNLIYDKVLDMKNEDQGSLLETPVPASYIRVEEAVTEICKRLEMEDKYPVLEDKYFRECVEDELRKNGFQLTRSDELDQAVKFLHGYGVLLHYEDPSLKDLYFVDPQWLCDMLAHVITVRNVNPYIRNGILKVTDLRNQIFRGERFPSSWVDKYIDLMSKFEVAIKISEKYLLVPSLLPEKQKACLKVHQSLHPEIRNVMDESTYLTHKVYRRQYLMSYVPTGFWARLITRLIADNRVCRIVTMCCDIVNSTATNEEEQKIEGDQLIRAAPPEWACWRTGIELTCFGAKLLRVCQLEKGMTFYGASHKSNKPFLVNDGVRDHLQGYCIEILSPCNRLVVERFVVEKKTKEGENPDNKEAETIGFRVISIQNGVRTAAQLLAIAVEHMDNLLADWYYSLDSFVSGTERKLVQRIVPCPICLRDAVSVDPASQMDGTQSKATDSPLEKNEPEVSGEKEKAEAGKKNNEVGPKKSKRGSSRCRRITDDVLSQGNKGDINEHKISTERDVKMEAHAEVSVAVDGVAGCDGESQSKSKPNSTDSTSGYSSEGDHSPSHCNNIRPRSENLSHSCPPLKSPMQCIFAFTFDEGVKRLNVKEPMRCSYHGEIDMKELFPDVVFVDLPPNFVISSDQLRKEKFLAAGSYGSVSKGKLISPGGAAVTVAIKVPYDTDPGENASTVAVRDAQKNRRFLEGAPTDSCTTMYKSIRQELSILVPVKHDHIIRLLGVSLTPLAMVIEFAPLGSLDQRLQDYQRAGRKLDPYVVQKCCIQIAQAMRYLHHHNIIYRDLKSENVLVWAFPDPSIRVPVLHAVHLKLADYGISRAVAIGGTKGLGGTSGFMAPEIVYYYGKESYTLKVDSFSFGSFMYELITLHQPFYDFGNKANLANQFVAEGKRPKLNAREKHAPLLILSLMYRCWAHDQDDRPSSNDIYGLCSLKEFPRLSDAFDLGETFLLQCAVSSHTACSAGSSEYADSRCVIGSVLWLCGKEKKERTMVPCMTVLSYTDSRRYMQKEIPLKAEIVVACSVGSTIWLATATGAILVYCSLTYRALAVGKPINQRIIHAILHAPVCHSVLVAQIDGSVFKYSDKVSSYQHYVPHADLSFYLADPTQDVPIRELIPSTVFQGDVRFGSVPIHCLAAVKRHSLVQVEEQEGGSHEDPASDADNRSKVELVTHYELWCGQERGILTILDLERLEDPEVLPVMPKIRPSPGLTNVSVRYLETLRTFDDNEREAEARVDSQDCDGSQDSSSLETLSESVWIVLYPGTTVYRWNVNKRTIESKVDASQYSPQSDLNSYKTSKKTKALHASNAQITAILVVEKDLYIGTSFGCLMVCDNQAMVPRLVLRCYEEPLTCLMPLRMTTARRNEGKHRNRLVLSSGRRCLDRWSRTQDRSSRSHERSARGHDKSRKKVIEECTVLTWLADQWEV